MLFVGGVVSSGAVIVLGLCALAYAGLLIAFAYGAWTLKPWAWALGVAVAIFGIVVAILQVILGGSSIFSQIISIVDRRRDPLLPQPALHQGSVRTRLRARTAVLTSR